MKLKRFFSQKLKQNAKNLRNNTTKHENILWSYLQKKQLNGLKFRRQQPIGNYIADFICFSERIIIELDGGQHNKTENIIKDNMRDEFLKSEGFKVIRIWNNDIYDNIEGVMEYLKNNTIPKSQVSASSSKENSIKIQCPAKINLTLKVLNRRDDGFHNIESIMQTISLYDYLEISCKPSDKFEINLCGNNTEIPYNEKNLVYKAAKLFIESTNILPHKIDIYIEKNIPVAAGLAGGSTDAAGTIFGLNEIFNTPLAKQELHKLCAKLGSDLNFCLEGGKQMTEGRGEILSPLEFEKFNISLIKPQNLGISAKEAYTKFSEKKTGNFQSKFGSRDSFKNDLEWAVIDDYKELETIKKLYPQSVMSGSGSTYFIIDKEFKPIDNYWIANSLETTEHGICKV